MQPHERESLFHALDRWLASFMLAVDEVLPMGWFNMRSDERREWIRRAS